MLVLGYLPITFGTPMWEQTYLGIIEKITGLHLFDNVNMYSTSLGDNIIIGTIFIGPILIGSLLGWLYGKINSR